MAAGDDLRLRTKRLALEVINVVEGLPPTPTVDVLYRPVIRSVTSVGANYRAACRSQTRAAFVAKISVVIEECDETMYWLELMRELKLIADTIFSKLHDEANQLVAIFVKSKLQPKQTEHRGIPTFIYSHILHSSIPIFAAPIV